MKRENLIGKKFNNLLVLRENGKSKHGHTILKCKCDCGNEKDIIYSRVKNGKTKSCGCLSVKHNLSKTPEFQTWSHMKARCYNSSHKQYKDYGGRCIKMCQRWLDSFENFYEDMGKRPSKDHSIDREDNNGDYRKLNCRWATSKEQCRNQRTNRLITHKGVIKCLAEWAEEYGLNQATLKSRLDIQGLTIEDALKKPIRPMEKLYTYKNKAQNITQWAKEYGMSSKKVGERLRNGWTIEKALKNSKHIMIKAIAIYRFLRPKKKLSKNTTRDKMILFQCHKCKRTAVRKSFKLVLFCKKQNKYIKKPIGTYEMHYRCKRCTMKKVIKVTAIIILTGLMVMALWV